MRQPFAVLIPRRRLAPNGAWRRGTGRSWRQADRRMNMRPTGRLSDRSTRSPNARPPGRRSVGASLTRRESNMRAFVIATLIAAGLGLAGTDGRLALPGERKRHRSRSRGQSADRAGLLAALLLAPVAPVAPVVSSLVIITSDKGRESGPGPVRAIPPRPLRGATSQCGDEVCPRVRERKAARLEHVAHQKESGEREALVNLLRRRIFRHTLARNAGNTRSCPSTARPA
jgi:hypothetical protein